tara:strand:+ start:3888 stop:4313 length:426 start_codon:yes stop_codon:yes gene_type:complete
MKFIFRSILVGISIAILIYPFNSNVSAFMNNNIDNNSIVEHLRVKVPSAYKDIWLEVEKKTWEPWLEKQEGFLGRKLYWDRRSEEATLLISWASRMQWKSISRDEIDKVQEKFENLAMQLIPKSTINPFKIQYEGELFPQK